MSRIPAAGLTIAAAAACFVIAPAALAAPSPVPSVPRLAVSAAPADGSRPSLPLVIAPRAPQQSATPRPSEDPGDIEVPAGKADVSDAPVPGHTNDLLAVVLAGGGALLLAGGAVVVVARRRA